MTAPEPRPKIGTTAAAPIGPATIAATAAELAAAATKAAPEISKKIVEKI